MRWTLEINLAAIGIFADLYLSSILAFENKSMLRIMGQRLVKAQPDIHHPLWTLFMVRRSRWWRFCTEDFFWREILLGFLMHIGLFHPHGTDSVK